MLINDKMSKMFGILCPFILALTSCQSLKVYVDRDPDFEVSRYSTYDWNLMAPNKEVVGLYADQVVDALVTKHVDSIMKMKRYEIKAANAHLQVHFHIILEDKSLAPTESYLYESNILWIRDETDPYYFEQGTLIVDMVDKSTGCLIWRSRGVALIENANRDNLDLRISKALQKMLKSFPKSAVIPNSRSK